ncbi:hypothetical protein TRFO_11596 [Tritrichomonas foetus]|uniref:Uncharacterized protein n=1 Tax=Tritrichomonas foetus TaxID=1144522 RepID=A0A1J4J354_9EUKA|nr:hypothetical protein TRFO_11596 [Tritrichomonas foetus]|eukprot:OHS93786.1 hypothetical protein TRFO_11596 [Tritrichomonas foetus]
MSFHFTQMETDNTKQTIEDTIKVNEMKERDIEGYNKVVDILTSLKFPKKELLRIAKSLYYRCKGTIKKPGRLEGRKKEAIYCWYRDNWNTSIQYVQADLSKERIHEIGGNCFNYEDIFSSHKKKVHKIAKILVPQQFATNNNNDSKTSISDIKNEMLPEEVLMNLQEETFLIEDFSDEFFQDKEIDICEDDDPYYFCYN